MLRVLIAEDHAVTRRGIVEILNSAFPNMVSQAVSNAEDLMHWLLKVDWDIVISDISMPGRSGLDLLHDIGGQFPKLPILILSVYPLEEYAVRVLRAGAAGYLNKFYTSEDELVQAVKYILSGKKYIIPPIAELMANELSKKISKKPHELLSNKEYEVFKLLIQGATTREIADKLALSVNTIATFRSRILFKMNLKNNAALAAYGVVNGLM